MRSKVNRVLAVLFCAGILLVSVMTLITSGRSFAYGFFKSYTDQLRSDSDVFDNIEARIYKLNYNAEYRLWGRDALRRLSARSQMLPFKHLINIADYDMLRLNSGGYYNVSSGPYDPEYALEHIAFAKDIEKNYGIKTALVYCHCALYEDGLLPGDSAYYDNNNAYADKLIGEFRSAGISVCDSRDSYIHSGLTINEAINKSDVHWTHLMALYTAYDAAKTVNRDLGLNLDAEALNPENFEREVYEKRLSGEYAKRVGDSMVEADDVYVLYPKYDTHILYEELGVPGSKREGSFRDAAIIPDNLEPDEGKSYSSNAYYIYGHYLAQTHTVNPDAANNVRVLVFKDSYGSPLSIFMGLSAREVYSVDPRSSTKTIDEWVSELKPDLVIFAYSEQTFRRISAVIAAD